MKTNRCSSTHLLGTTICTPIVPPRNFWVTYRNLYVSRECCLEHAHIVPPHATTWMAVPRPLSCPCIVYSPNRHTLRGQIYIHWQRRRAARQTSRFLGHRFLRRFARKMDLRAHRILQKNGSTRTCLMPRLRLNPQMKGALEMCRFMYPSRFATLGIANSYFPTISL